MLKHIEVRQTTQERAQPHKHHPAENMLMHTMHPALLELVVSRTVAVLLLAMVKTSGPLNLVGCSVHSQLFSCGSPLLDWSLEGR